MKKIISIVIVCLISFVFAASAFAAPEYTIKVGSIVSDTHADMIAMKKVFVPAIENGSKGKIKVELYPNAQLGGDRELCEAVQLGTIQMALPASSALAGFDKRIQVLDLPYLFTSRKAAFEALEKSEMFKEKGVSGEADQKANADGESPEMKIIKQKASKK